ncbi:hypothetical protein BLOT_010703 [Blomia tropicalis]|nr:hypothetical protein BLOT_010703 [Blomia tropicalis]
MLLTADSITASRRSLSGSNITGHDGSHISRHSTNDLSRKSTRTSCVSGRLHHSSKQGRHVSAMNGANTLGQNRIDVVVPSTSHKIATGFDLKKGSFCDDGIGELVHLVRCHMPFN